MDECKALPRGTLNYKYSAEWAVRKAGAPYTIVRPTGLLPTPEIDAAAASAASGAAGAEASASTLQVWMDSML